MSSVSVRSATSDDVPTLGRLGALLVRTHYDFDQKRFMPVWPETETRYGQYLASQFGKPDVAVLVAELDGEVVGYAYGGLEGYDYMALRGPAGALYDIVVDPSRRKQGVGQALLAAIMDFLKSRGAPRVVLSTAEQNDEAQRLFARGGFRRTMVEMTAELND